MKLLRGLLLMIMMVTILIGIGGDADDDGDDVADCPAVSLVLVG